VNTDPRNIRALSKRHSGLTTLAYSLKRMLNLVSFEKLMAALA
jgi:hypothetical protein